METEGLPKVEYRRLGNSGLRVSVPILGAMSLGTDKWAPWVFNEDKALPLLKAAYDRGVNTWDTANMYSNGESERLIGKALKQYNIPRSKVVILTKCFGLVHDDPSVHAHLHPHMKDSPEYVNTSGLSRQAIFHQVSASLARLDTEYIDLLQIHRYDPDVPMEETMCALHDLIRAGKVRYIGASSMFAWQLAEYNHIAERNGWTKFVSMQNNYSLLYREEEREMIAYCKHAGIGLIPYGPLASGQLARPLGQSTVREDISKGSPYEMKKSEADQEILRRVEQLAKEKGWAMGQVAQAWIRTKVTSPIIGVSSVARLEEAIIPDKKLTEDEIRHLEEPYLPKAVAGHT